MLIYYVILRDFYMGKIIDLLGGEKSIEIVHIYYILLITRNG